MFAYAYDIPVCLSTARIDGEKKRTKPSRLDSIRLQKYEIKIPRHEEPSSRRAFIFCWRCLAQAYFRHRIFIRFTYRPCRNYSYSWRLSRIFPSSLGRENFSFLPLSYPPPFPPFPERKSVHIFTSSLISSLIASYGLRVSVLINLPSLLVLVHFYLLPVSAFCVRGAPETASVRRINRKRSYIYLALTVRVV